MAKITDILKNTTQSSDFGMVSGYPGATEDEQRTSFWQHVIVAKSSDSGFGHLVESILEHGFTSDIGWDGEYLMEGHHRLVAAILLGFDEVPATICGTDDRVLDVNAHWNEEDEYPIEVSF